MVRRQTGREARETDGGGGTDVVVVAVGCK